MRLADHLVDRRPARFGLAVGRLRGEGSRSPIKVGIDPRLVAADLIDLPHDQQLLAQRLQGFQHPLKTLGLQRSGNAQPEEHVERPHGNIRLRRRLSSSPC
jgi:hypothetical protein